MRTDRGLGWRHGVCEGVLDGSGVLVVGLASHLFVSPPRSWAWALAIFGTLLRVDRPADDEGKEEHGGNAMYE